MSVQQRVDAIDWQKTIAELDNAGVATFPPILTLAECEELVALYDRNERFRSRIQMERFRFGAGEYKYFADPLPSIVADLRKSLYPRLAPEANSWMEKLNLPHRYPATLPEFLEVCARKEQTKPTPLVLRYEAGGYNCLHQDIYGEVAFPLQATFLLSRTGEDFTGGEFLLLEQRPRQQSRGHAFSLQQGEAIIFATRERPAMGSRGYYRANLKHGVSTVTSGMRFTLGIIFHNAK